MDLVTNDQRESSVCILGTKLSLFLVQVCPLCLVLFVVCMDVISSFSQIEDGGCQFGNLMDLSLLFANDVALLGSEAMVLSQNKGACSLQDKPLLEA